MNEDDRKNFATATCCCICGKQFGCYSRINDRLVRHHCHVTGKYISAAHNECNLKL